MTEPFATLLVEASWAARSATCANTPCCSIRRRLRRRRRQQRLRLLPRPRRARASAARPSRVRTRLLQLRRCRQRPPPLPLAGQRRAAMPRVNTWCVAAIRCPAIVTSAIRRQRYRPRHDRDLSRQPQCLRQATSIVCAPAPCCVCPTARRWLPSTSVKQWQRCGSRLLPGVIRLVLRLQRHLPIHGCA